jgi:hypothetical protein
LCRDFALGEHEIARLAEHRERQIPEQDIHGVLHAGALDRSSMKDSAIRMPPVSHEAGPHFCDRGHAGLGEDRLAAQVIVTTL